MFENIAAIDIGTSSIKMVLAKKGLRDFNITDLMIEKIDSSADNQEDAAREALARLLEKNQVKGLTTSAGLWATAITGLAFGSGFYEGGVLTTVLILLAETVLSRYEYASHNYVRRQILYVEFTRRAAFDFIMSEMKTRGDRIEEVEMTQDGETKERNGKTQRAYVYYRAAEKETEVETKWMEIPGIDLVELI